MNMEERTQLTRLLQLLGQAQAGAKDPEAEGLIRDATARQPDAAYLLVQRVLQLENEIQSMQKSSFIGDPNAWGRPPVASQPAAQTNVQTPMQQAPMQQAPIPTNTWGSGLLGNVAGAAAGVVAGSLLAHGIGSLMGRNAEASHAAVPPGGGTLVETDYAHALSKEDADGGYIADDFDTGDGTDAEDSL